MKIRNVKWKSGESLIVYGAGQFLEKRYTTICEQYRIEAIVDKNKSGSYEGIPIYGLEYLIEKSSSKIIIMIENRDICVEVADMLVSQYGFLRENIKFGANIVYNEKQERLFKVGIMGCGSIASQMAAAILNTCSDIKVYACASRNQDKADNFAYKYDIEKAYGSYIDMLQNDELDLIYIATPVSEHYHNMEQCIKYGKNILCEKTFVINAEQASGVFKLAKEKSLYVAEAMTIRYHSIYRTLQRILADELIGEVLHVHANFNYKIDNLDRMKDLYLGGGALFELGIYSLNFATICLGYEIVDIVAHCKKFKTGTDAWVTLLMQYKKGKTASLSCDTRCAGKNQGAIYGDKGFIVIDNINQPLRMQIYDNNRRLLETYYPEENESGLANEMIVARQAIQDREIQCIECTPEHTIAVMQMLDQIREQLELKYPTEE